MSPRKAWAIRIWGNRPTGNRLKNYKGYQATGLKVKRATMVTGLPGTQGHRETGLQEKQGNRHIGPLGNHRATGLYGPVERQKDGQKIQLLREEEKKREKKTD